jgi:phosphoglycolate phosphatase-like HAD superfamily hydrolase
MDDLHAAKAASLQYIMVGWGFGNFTNKFHDQVIMHPYDLTNKLNV